MTSSAFRSTGKSMDVPLADQDSPRELCAPRRVSKTYSCSNPTKWRRMGLNYDKTLGNIFCAAPHAKSWMEDKDIFALSKLKRIQRSFLDTIRPMEMSKDFRYIFSVIIDAWFTWYIERLPENDITATAMKDTLWRHSCRFGTPLEILTDRGILSSDAVYDGKFTKILHKSTSWSIADYWTFWKHCVSQEPIVDLVRQSTRENVHRFITKQARYY